MAALTETSINQHSLGSLNLYQVKFSSVDSEDTWASGLSAVIDQWANVTTTQSTETNGGCNVSESSGTFTIIPSQDGVALTLFVLANDG